MLFCNTEAFGNLKPKELEELFPDCWEDFRPTNRYLNATHLQI